MIGRNGLPQTLLLTFATLAALPSSVPAAAADAAVGTVFETSFTTTKPDAGDYTLLFSRPHQRRLPA